MSNDLDGFRELEGVLANISEREKEIARIRKERSELLNDELGVMQQQLEERIQNNQAMQRGLKNLQNQKDLSQLMLDQSSDAYKELVNISNTLGISMEELNEQIKNGTINFEEMGKQLQISEARMREAKNTMSELGQLGGKFANSLGLAADASKTTAGQALGMAQKMQEAAKAGISFKEQMGAVFGTSFNLMNILFSIVDILGKFVIETDNVAKNFQKATGFTGNFRDNIQSVSAELAATGISSADVGKNMQSLAENFSGFDKNADAVNNQLVKSLSLLNNLGVSTADSAKNLNFLTKSMGMTVEQADAVNIEIATMGDGMSVTASKMMSDFKSVSGQLAVYGPRMGQVFKQLAAQAKETGMEVSQLVGLANRFDTFSDAAGNAGKLNAVLGTNISALEMMNMNEAERVELLRSQIKESVGNFDNLDRYTQKFVAQALGLKDVAEARALVNMSEEEAAANVAKQEQAAKTQEELLKLSEGLVPVLDQAKMAFMKLALSLTPVIEAMSFILQFTGNLIQTMREEYVIVGSMIALYGVMYAVKSRKLILDKIETAQIYAMIAADKLKAFWTAVRTQGLIASIAPTITATVANYGLGASMFFALGAILLVVGAFYLLYKAFHRKGSPAFYLMFGLIALGVIALGVAMYFAGPAITPVVLSLALLAISVALIFHQMGALVKLVTAFVETLASLADKLVIVVGAMISLILHLPMAAVATQAVAAGIFMMALAVGALGIAAAASLAVIVLLFAAIAGMGAIFAGIGIFGGVMVLKSLAEDIANIGKGMLQFGSGLERAAAFASNFKSIMGDGVLIVRADGDATSLVAGSGDIMKNFSDGKLTVDVKMPDMGMPEITVNVFVDKQGEVVDIQKIIGGR